MVNKLPRYAPVRKRRKQTKTRVQARNDHHSKVLCISSTKDKRAHAMNSTDWKQPPKKKPNTIKLWGNETTMNINEMVLSNITSSLYYRLDLHKFKTHYELIDEIYYKVDHLEPWEKGSRRISGQQRQIGGVRGVGAGGLASTAFCILYKLFSIKLTRNQLNQMINHVDSPYIRGIGFLYIRYCTQPNEFWDWFEPYLDDDEPIDPKAGGGRPMTVGSMVRYMISQIDWFNTLFPRIPVPVQNDLKNKLAEYDRKKHDDRVKDSHRNDRKNRKHSYDRDDSRSSRHRKRSGDDKDSDHYHRKHRRHRSRSSSVDVGRHSSRR